LKCKTISRLENNVNPKPATAWLIWWTKSSLWNISLNNYWLNKFMLQEKTIVLVNVGVIFKLVRIFQIKVKPKSKNKESNQLILEPELTKMILFLSKSKIMVIIQCREVLSKQRCQPQWRCNIGDWVQVVIIIRLLKNMAKVTTLVRCCTKALLSAL